MTRDLEAEYLEFANKAANETDPKLKERWAGIAVGMRTVLNALASRSSAIVEEPSGWKLVPIERTQEMHDAAQKTTGALLTRGHTADIWAQMLAAAPPSPQPHTGRAGVTEEMVEAAKVAIRKALTDNLKDLETLDTFDVDVLLRGCQHAMHSRGYANPTEAADILAAFAARAALNAALTVEPEAPDNAFAEYEGVPAKELAETVARYGKALKEISSPTQTEGLLWWQIKAREALAGVEPEAGEVQIGVDELAQHIRIVDGENSLGAGALAEKLLPFILRHAKVAP